MSHVGSVTLGTESKFPATLRLAAIAALTSLTIACTPGGAGESATGAEPPVTDAAASEPGTLPPRSQPSLPARELVTVYKSPTCGCCNAWVDHLRSEGFEVRTEDRNDMGSIKARLGVPYGMGSCHTATVAGYTLEGHVPASEIRRLLAERPEIKGLAVPGMPIGSPGMEVGDRADPYEVVAFSPQGTSVFRRYP